MSTKTGKKNVVGDLSKKNVTVASKTVPGTDASKMTVTAVQKTTDTRASKKYPQPESKQPHPHSGDERDGSKVDTKMTSMVGLLCIAVVILVLGVAALLAGIFVPMQDLLIVGAIFTFAGIICIAVAVHSFYRGCQIRRNKVADQTQMISTKLEKDQTNKDIEGPNYLEGQDTDVDFSQVHRKGSPPHDMLYGKDPVLNLAKKINGSFTPIRDERPPTPKVAMPVVGNDTNESGRTTVFRRVESVQHI